MAQNLKLQVVLNAMDRASGPLRNMRGSVQKATKSLREQQKALNALKKEQNLGSSSGAMLKDQLKIQAQIDKTTKSIDQQKRHLERLAKQQAASARGNQLMWKGARQMATATGAIYGAARFMQPGFSFGSEMSKVQALTRLDKNDPMMAALREQAKELGRSTSFTATQAAEAQAFYAMAGFNPEDIINALPSTLDLALASGMDVGRAADIGSNIMASFGIDSSEMERVSDILVSVFTRSNTSLEMLGDTMKYVGPIAKSLDISLEETTAMAGILGNIGIQGGKAGTSLQRIYSRLAAPNSSGRKALEALNIDAADAEGNLRAVPEVILEILKATEKMGNAERLGILTDIVGQQGAAAFMGFLDEGNLQDLERVVTAAYENQGEAARTAETMQDNVKGDWVKFTSAIEGIRIAFTETNEEGLRPLLQSITKMAERFGTFVASSPKLVALISKIAAGVVGLVAALGTVNIAMGLFNKLVLANPIVFFATVIAGAALLIYRYWDEIKGYTIKAWWAINDYILGKIEALQNKWNEFKGFMGDIWTGIKDFAKDAWDSIVNYVMEKVEWLMGLIDKAMAPFRTEVKLYNEMNDQQKIMHDMRREDLEAGNAFSGDEVGRFNELRRSSVNNNTMNQTNTVTINTQTNASPNEIAGAVDDVLRGLNNRGANYAIIGDLD